MTTMHQRQRRRAAADRSDNLYQAAGEALIAAGVALIAAGVGCVTLWLWLARTGGLA